MESLLKELKRILSQADDADQKAMIFQLKEMLWSLETGDDTVNRMYDAPEFLFLEKSLMTIFAEVLR